MLFILVMDPLQKIIDMATQEGLLTPVGALGRWRWEQVSMRMMSSYSCVLSHRMWVTCSTCSISMGRLVAFAQTSKSPRCSWSDVKPLTSLEHLDNSRYDKAKFHANIWDWYYGLVESGKKMNKFWLTKLPRWKGKLMNKSGRLTLVNSVLSSIVLYHMIVFTLSKWEIKKIDKIGRNFIWQGSENAKEGHCLVNWKRVQQPKKLDGLGILELRNFNKALRLCW
jgi:hypothetical protein